LRRAGLESKETKKWRGAVAGCRWLRMREVVTRHGDGDGSGVGEGGGTAVA
jgi:hypothetical protein